MELKEAVDALRAVTESEIDDNSADQALKDLAAWVKYAEQDDIGLVLGVETADRLDEFAQDAVVRAMRGMLQLALPALVLYGEIARRKGQAVSKDVSVSPDRSCEALLAIVRTLKPLVPDVRQRVLDAALKELQRRHIRREASLPLFDRPLKEHERIPDAF